MSRPLVETSDETPPPRGVKTYTTWVKGSPWRLFHQTHVRIDNDTAQPSIQRASSIRSTHGKYKLSRALVNGFCLLSTNIVAFRKCFLLNWSDASDQSSSFASLSSSHGHTRRKTHCLYGQGWCIGSWVGVIDSFSLALHHLDAWLSLAKKSISIDTTNYESNQQQH